MAGSLEFDDFSSDYLNNNKSTFRKAGDAFTVGSGNTINNSSTGGSSNSSGSAYDKWMTFMGNQSSNNNSYRTQSNNQNSMTASTSNMSEPSGSTSGNNNVSTAVAPKKIDVDWRGSAEENSAWEQNRINELNDFFTNYKGPLTAGSDMNAEGAGGQQTTQRANNVMTHLDFRNKLQERKQLTVQQNRRYGRADDFELPENPEYWQAQIDKEKAEQAAAMAADADGTRKSKYYKKSKM